MSTDLTTPTAVVQRFYQALGAGDPHTMLSLVGDDLHWEMKCDSRAPYGGVLGKAGLPGFLGAVAQADDIQVFEPREFLAGGDHVTVIGWEKTIMRPGNGTVECDWVHVWTVRDGLVRRFWGMLDTERAARARAG